MSAPKRMRGGSGLGDSVYLRPLAEHLTRAGVDLEICTNYPQIFAGVNVRTTGFSREKIDYLAHYSGRKFEPHTTQWQDICITAGIRDNVPMRFDWQIQNIALVRSLTQEAAGKPIVIVHGGRTPMGRTDGFGIELLPMKRGFDIALEAIADDCYLVQVGNAPQLYPISVHRNLNGGTTVADLLDVFSLCDGVVAQCSFAVPMAEAFDKPLLGIWAGSGVRSKQRYVAAVTPQKIFSNRKSSYAMDDAQAVDIEGVARAFLKV